MHYPFYETWDSAANRELDLSKPDFGARGLGFDGGGRRGAQPVPSKQLAVADFEPLLAEFGVDLFFAGHDHNYEVSAVFWCGTRLRGRWSDLWCCLCVRRLGRCSRAKSLGRSRSTSQPRPSTFCPAPPAPRSLPCSGQMRLTGEWGVARVWCSAP